jgi:hypothetical protein
MQNAADSEASVQSEAQNNNYSSIVSDLTSLMSQVLASMRLIESAIVGESPPGNQEVDSNVIVLDDVTPRYVTARAALRACNAGLGAALHSLMDTRPDASAECSRRPVRLGGRA